MSKDKKHPKARPTLTKRSKKNWREGQITFEKPTLPKIRQPKSLPGQLMLPFD